MTHHFLLSYLIAGGRCGHLLGLISQVTKFDSWTPLPKSSCEVFNNHERYKMKKIFSVYSWYDNYDLMIVIADSEDEARNMHPSGQFCTQSSETVEVEFLGNAKKGSQSGIVLKSFNAG